MVKIVLTDALTCYRSLELFGTFLPYNEKTPVGEKLVITSMVVIWQLYIVEVLHLETTLSYKMLAQ